MGDMGEYFNAWRDHKRENRRRNLNVADPTGWTQHTAHHWSRDLLGDKIDYWPTSDKFRWRGKTRTGGIEGFMRNQRAKVTIGDGQ